MTVKLVLLLCTLIVGTLGAPFQPNYNDFGSMFSGHDVIGQAFEEIQSGAGVNMNSGRTGAQTTGTAGSQLLDFGLNYAAADIQHESTAYNKNGASGSNSYGSARTNGIADGNGISHSRANLDTMSETMVNNLFGPSMAKAQVGGFGEYFGQGGPFGSGQSRTILDTVANTFQNEFGAGGSSRVSGTSTGMGANGSSSLHLTNSGSAMHTGPNGSSYAFSRGRGYAGGRGSSKSTGTINQNTFAGNGIASASS